MKQRSRKRKERKRDYNQAQDAKRKRNLMQRIRIRTQPFPIPSLDANTDLAKSLAGFIGKNLVETIETPKTSWMMIPRDER